MTIKLISEMYRIILGSGSPRRRELLEAMGVEFTVDTGNRFDEQFSEDTAHENVPALMSEGKSFGFHRELEEDEVLITSDTMVLCDGRIMGKPKNRDEAIAMLRQLSGREHRVITAVSFRTGKKPDEAKTSSDTAYVCFKELTDNEIEYYVDNYKPYDKAGAYGIQEWIGYIGITGIRGSFFTIMGFPTHLVWEGLNNI